MGVCNPASSVIHYRLDEEVGTALNVQESDEDVAEYRLQLLAKSGKVISEVSLEGPLSSVGTLQKDLTIGISVGGLGAGTVLKEGTPITEIVKRMFTAPTFYWGFIKGKTLPQVKELPVADILRPTVPMIEEQCPVEFTPTSTTGVLVVVLPAYVEEAVKASSVNAELGTSLDRLCIQAFFRGIEGAARSISYGSWTAQGVIGDEAYWAKLCDTIDIGGQDYVVYGWGLNEWNTENAKAKDGSVDKIEISFLEG